jgi:phage terminase large subunit-like protein
MLATNSPQLVLRHKQATTPQRAFWRDGARFRLFVGGVGSGKTRAGCVEILRQPAKSVGMVVAPTYPMLRDATMRTFIELAQRGKVLQAFHKAEMQATLIDGKRVLFRSADDPDRLRGPNLGWFYLDEAALMDADVWPIMIGRLRELPGRAWATSTPRGFNWMHEVFVNGGVDYTVVRSATRDNTFLPDGFLRSLEQSYDTAWVAQELEGEFLDLGSIDHFLPSIVLWDACKADLPPLDGHTPCVLALDGAESNDTFASVIVSSWADGVAVRYVRPYVPKPGQPLDFDAIEADIRALCRRYAVQQIAYDPFLLGQLIRRLTTGDSPIPVACEPFPQGAQRLESDKGLYDLITSRRLAHDGDAELRAHIANANRKIDTKGGGSAL